MFSPPQLLHDPSHLPNHTTLLFFVSLSSNKEKQKQNKN